RSRNPAGRARPRRRGDRVSNCDVVAGRSLIHLVASRLALRAPALRAATALTRPNGSARGLACGRHIVPTGRAVGPNDVVANHRVECGDHLTHHGDDDDLRLLSSGFEAIVEHLERWIVPTGIHRGHEEHVADRCAATPDATHPFEEAAVEVV